jgi:hypothetical protein
LATPFAPAILPGFWPLYLVRSFIRTRTRRPVWMARLSFAIARVARMLLHGQG